MENRVYVNDPTSSHLREVPVSRLLPHLLGVALESLAIYGPVIVAEDLSRIISAFAQAVDTACAHAFNPDSRVKLQRLFQSMKPYAKVSVVDEFLANPDMLEFFAQLSTQVAQSQDSLLKQVKTICTHFPLDIAFFQSRSLIHFRRTPAVKLVVQVSRQTAVFRYARLQYYHSEQANVPVNATVASCGHGFCRCQQFSVEALPKVCCKCQAVIWCPSHELNGFCFAC